MHYTYLSYFQSGLVTLIKSWVCFSFLASGPSSLYIYAGLVFFLPSILLRWICSSTTIENRKVLKFRIICCKRYFPSSQFKCAAMTSWTGVGEFFMCNSNAASESPDTACLEKPDAAAEVSHLELSSSSIDPPCAHWQGGRRQQLCLLNWMHEEHRVREWADNCTINKGEGLVFVKLDLWCLITSESKKLSKVAVFSLRLLLG